MKIGEFLSKEDQGKLRNMKIGLQFGELIQGVRKMRNARIRFVKGKLYEVKFNDDNFSFMPTIEKGKVMMVYVGKKYAEYTVEEFLKKFKV